MFLKRLFFCLFFLIPALSADYFDDHNCPYKVFLNEGDITIHKESHVNVTIPNIKRGRIFAIDFEIDYEGLPPLFKSETGDIIGVVNYYDDDEGFKHCQFFYRHTAPINEKGADSPATIILYSTLGETHFSITSVNFEPRGFCDFYEGNTADFFHLPEEHFFVWQNRLNIPVEAKAEGITLNEITPMMSINFDNPTEDTYHIRIVSVGEEMCLSLADSDKEGRHFPIPETEKPKAHTFTYTGKPSYFNLRTGENTRILAFEIYAENHALKPSVRDMHIFSLTHDVDVFEGVDVPYVYNVTTPNEFSLRLPRGKTYSLCFFNASTIHGELQMISPETSPIDRRIEDKQNAFVCLEFKTPKKAMIKQIRRKPLEGHAAQRRVESFKPRRSSLGRSTLAQDYQEEDSTVSQSNAPVVMDFKWTTSRLRARDQSLVLKGIKLAAQDKKDVPLLPKDQPRVKVTYVPND